MSPRLDLEKRAQAAASSLGDEVAREIERLVARRDVLNGEIERLEALQLALLEAADAAGRVAAARSAAVTTPIQPDPTPDTPEKSRSAPAADGENPDETLAWARKWAFAAEAANDPDEVARAHAALDRAEEAVRAREEAAAAEHRPRVKLAPVFALDSEVDVLGSDGVTRATPPAALQGGARFWGTAAKAVDERLVEVSEPPYADGEQLRVPLKAVRDEDGEPVLRPAPEVLPDPPSKPPRPGRVAPERASLPVGRHAVAVVLERPGKWHRTAEVAETVARERGKRVKKVRDAVRKGLEAEVARGGIFAFMAPDGFRLWRTLRVGIHVDRGTPDDAPGLLSAAAFAYQRIRDFVMYEAPPPRAPASAPEPPAPVAAVSTPVAPVAAEPRYRVVCPACTGDVGDVGTYEGACSAACLNQLEREGW